MLRRVHVADLHAGTIELSPAAAHHARDVLRLKAGDRVEVFDDGGRTAAGRIVDVAAGLVEVDAVADPQRQPLLWTVAAAVPKGARADWMIEKLSELGTAQFVPLVTERSVVVPEGQAKLQRWQRLATESARQSRRAGVMKIGPLAKPAQLIESIDGPGWFLSTTAGAGPVLEAAAQVSASRASHLTVLVGPEGGWTHDETATMQAGGLTSVSLGPTILRVETAAIAAAAILGAMAGKLKVES